MMNSFVHLSNIILSYTVLYVNFNLNLNFYL
nr:MAG TPA: hypothetical protein [Caudoviricetes sp.]